jgi:MFS family permease
MMVGLVLFLTGSALSGAAQTIGVLIGYRALQGLGAGAVQTTSLTIIGDLFSLSERGKLQGLFAAMWGIAGISGPLLGGLIVDSASWRWIFFINLPFGFLAFAGLYFSFHEQIAPKLKRPHLDWLGALLMTIAVVAALAAAGGEHALILWVVAAVCTCAFLIVERRSPDALLPLDLFSQRLMVITSTQSALTGATMFAAVTYLPLYVQGAAHGSPTEAGITLTPMMVGWPIASTITGRLVPHFGYRPFTRIGSATVLVATVCLAYAIQHELPMAYVYTATAMFGGGLGLVTTSQILAVQFNVPWQRRGVATAATMFFRVIGGALGVGFLGAWLAHAMLGAPGVTNDLVNALLGPEHGGRLPPGDLSHLMHALKAALSPIFWTIATLGGLFFVIGMFFPHLPLSDHSAEPLTVE